MKMTTDNWGEVMLSKDALRKIGKILRNLTPEDRMAVVAQLCVESKDDEELEMLTRPIRTTLQLRRAAVLRQERQKSTGSREDTLNTHVPKA
jgi:Na+/phosphate symporter